MYFLNVCGYKNIPVWNWSRKALLSNKTIQITPVVCLVRHDVITFPPGRREALDLFTWKSRLAGRGAFLMFIFKMHVLFLHL